MILPKTKIMADCNICSHCFIEIDVVVGHRVMINNRVLLYNGLRVGYDVFIGSNITFTNNKFPRNRQHPDSYAIKRKKLALRSGSVILLGGGAIGVNAIVGAGSATPVPVELEPATYNIDSARIETTIMPRTHALLPVHLYGQPVDLDPILDIARCRGLRVIKDAAQAHGVRYKGRRIGAHGDVVC